MRDPAGAIEIIVGFEPTTRQGQIVRLILAHRDVAPTPPQTPRYERLQSIVQRRIVTLLTSIPR